MADTKKGRDKQSRDEANRQQERELTEARERGDEAEPPEEAELPEECHRRDCTEPAQFVVVERYQEETGKGAVEATAYLCQSHTAEESPVNLDSADEDYLFRVEPVSATRA